MSYKTGILPVFFCGTKPLCVAPLCMTENERGDAPLEPPKGRLAPPLPRIAIAASWRESDRLCYTLYSNRTPSSGAERSPLESKSERAKYIKTHSS